MKGLRIRILSTRLYVEKFTSFTDALNNWRVLRSDNFPCVQREDVQMKRASLRPSPPVIYFV